MKPLAHRHDRPRRGWLALWLTTLFHALHWCAQLFFTFAVGVCIASEAWAALVMWVFVAAGNWKCITLSGECVQLERKIRQQHREIDSWHR